MNVSIFGLGYVGAVTAGCLTERGHNVIGADVQEAKVKALQDGVSPIIEPGLEQLLRTAKQLNRLRATTDASEAVQASEFSIVCVGTPSLESGRLNLEFVQKVSKQIAAAVTAKGTSHTLIYRSTMLPGSTRAMVREFFDGLQSSGMLTIYYCPEFLREGTAVQDFREPSLTVIGTSEGQPPESTDALEWLGRDASILNWEAAEMTKYACNYFHALKVGFANEMGRVSKFLHVDGARVMEVVCQDTRLNISPYYLKPGNPFGGSCLPKDVSALSGFARREGISLPLLDHTLESNQAHLDLLLKLIISKEKRKVGILGLAFKADTDDLRGSPMVAVAETLLGRGYELHIYDPQLNLSQLMGANEAEIKRRMPHLAQLLRDSAGEVMDQSEVLVVAQCCSTREEMLNHARPEHQVIDINGWAELKALPWKYEGLCW